MIVILLIFVTSCSQDSKNSSEATHYKLYRGDKLLKTSPNSQIEITQNSQKEYAVVKVLSGSIEIVKR